MSSGEWRTHSSEWEGTQTLRRERHSHRWPSMVRGAMLARPTRRATYHRALGSRELIPQNERELRRSEGSGMLIGDPPMVRGAVLARPSMSSWERRTHSSEWEGTHTLRRERHAHRWPSMVRGAMLARPTRSAPSLDLVSTSEVITAIALEMDRTHPLVPALEVST